MKQSFAVAVVVRMWSKQRLARRLIVASALTVLPSASLGQIYRWTDGTVINGTQFITPGPWADLGHLSLQYADLSSKNLTGVNLGSSRLDSARLTSSNLTQASFQYTNLTSADLTSADLTSADLGLSATLLGANLTGATLRAADLTRATTNGFTASQLYSTASYRNHDLGPATFQWCNLAGWDLSSQSLGSSTFYGSALTSAKLTGADLSSAYMAGADLTSASLASATLTSANLYGASVVGADLSYTTSRGLTHEMLFSTAGTHLLNLTGTSLAGNSMEGWSFLMVNMTSANLSSSSLAGASFYLATLTGAKFNGASIAGADLRSAKGLTAAQVYSTASYAQRSLAGTTLSADNLTGWNLAGQDLTSTLFSGSLMSGAVLASANLTSADLTSSTLTSADARSAVLGGANLTGANLRSTDLSLADLRGATGVALTTGTKTRGTIMPDGSVASFAFQAGETLSVRPATIAAVTGDMSGAGTVSVTGQLTAASANVSAISVAGRMAFSPHADGAAIADVMSALSLGSGAAGGAAGTLDLANHDLIVRAGSEAVVAGWVAGGLHGGPGITSSTAGVGTGRNALATLAVATNSDGAGGTLLGTLDGVTALPTDVIVRYTYAGDADLNGLVDGSDLAAALAGMNGGLHGWVNGDFNYDGRVDGQDIALLLNSLGNQGAPFVPGGSGGGGAVPEPGASSLVLALACPALAFRRRPARVG